MMNHQIRQKLIVMLLKIQLLKKFWKKVVEIRKTQRKKGKAKQNGKGKRNDKGKSKGEMKPRDIEFEFTKTSSI